MIEYMRQEPEEQLVECKDCGAHIYTGDVKMWIFRATSHGATTDPVCGKCDINYQVCGHKKTSLVRVPVVDEDEGTVSYCAECERLPLV